MNFIKTDISGLIIVEPKIFSDCRGHFFESYNQKEFSAHGIDINNSQDNQSLSYQNVLRGMHCQLNGHEQAKLVRTIYGSIQDIVVDIRVNSPTFGNCFSIELNSDNCLSLYIPKGFLHGFLTLSTTAIVSYKCDSFYCPSSEFTVQFDDPDLNLPWLRNDVIQSDKDKAGKSFKELCKVIGQTTKQ